MTMTDTFHRMVQPSMADRVYDFGNYDHSNYFFGLLTTVGGAQRLDSGAAQRIVHRTPLEEKLRQIQEAISEISMYLPKGFSNGLNRQFADMLDEDCWEGDDALIKHDALVTFLKLLLVADIKRRPGLGTDGRGAITAFWHTGSDRLTASCGPTGEVAWVLSHTLEDGTPEAAAGNCHPERFRVVLAPYAPEVWLD